MRAAEVRLPRPGATIGYRREGVGRPLLLLHATLATSDQLAPLATRLAARSTVISVDRRGSGTSPLDPSSPIEPLDVGVHVDDILAVTAAEGLDACALVGHSYGACVALELAARRPRVVRSVFAWEPPYAPLAPADEQARLARLALATLAASQEEGLAGAAEVFLAGVAGPTALATLSSGAREQLHGLGAAAVGEAPLLGLDPGGLRAIACPVTIATGSRSAPWYRAIADALVERIPRARLVELPGLDHMAPIREPDIIAAAVEGHLDR